MYNKLKPARSTLSSNTVFDNPSDLEPDEKLETLVKGILIPIMQIAVLSEWIKKLSPVYLPGTGNFTNGNVIPNPCAVSVKSEDDCISAVPTILLSR